MSASLRKRMVLLYSANIFAEESLLSLRRHACQRTAECEAVSPDLQGQKNPGQKNKNNRSDFLPPIFLPLIRARSTSPQLRRQPRRFLIGCFHVVQKLPGAAVQV